MKLKTKDFLSFSEISAEEVEGVIEMGIQMKKELKEGRSQPRLKNTTLVMIFEKPSTRTRVSFEVGIAQMGGYSINLAPGDMQISRGETIQDTARTLALYADVIMARVFDHATLEILAVNADVPVINGLSDSFHPCQTLADLMTIKEKKRRLGGLRVAWVGDGNNVCNSLIYGCARVGMDLSIATPDGFEPIPSAVAHARKYVNVDLVKDPKDAVRGADVVMTDTFTSIHNKEPGRIEKFLPRYQVDESLMSTAGGDAIFMHCLPAKRGMEVTAGVIDGPQSVVWDQAENRLHSQKALLLAILDAPAEQ